MSLINLSSEHIYCSSLVPNHVLIRLIRLVSRFTVHFYNAIYFSTTFSTPCKRFTKILYFFFTASKHGLGMVEDPKLLAGKFGCFIVRLKCSFVEEFGSWCVQCTPS